MKRDTLSYHGYRFLPDIISHAVWLYHRFGVSFRDVEDLLAQRGITVSYEAIRLWCLTFGSVYARRLKRRQGRLGDIWRDGGLISESLAPASGQQQVTGDRTAPSGTVTTYTQGLVSGEFLLVVRFSEPSAGFAISDLTIVNGHATRMASLSDGTKHTVYGDPYRRMAACGGRKSCYCASGRDAD